MRRFYNRRPGSNTPPHGIFYLGSLNSQPVVSRLNNAWIDGYASRWLWTSLDAGITAPAYNFTNLLTAVSTVHSYKKKITICIHPISVPTYVYNSTTNYYTCHAGGVTATVQPWSSSAQSFWALFLSALADAMVDGYHLRDHPALAGIRVGIVGNKGIDNSDQMLSDSPGYSRAVNTQAHINYIHIMQNAFPRTYVYIETGTCYDDIADPGMDDTLLYALNAEFDGVRYAHYGSFIENLKGDYPNALGNLDVNITIALSGGSAQLCQACGSWLNHAPCSWTAGDDTPVNGFNLAYPSYDCKYYELYWADLLNAPWQSDFLTWQTTFAT